MSKSYQDPDVLHGHGKAIPKPKRPTQYTYRGSRFGHTGLTVERSTVQTIRKRKVEKATANSRPIGMLSIIAVVARLLRRASRNR